MLYTTVYVDLDDTMYDSSCGLWQSIRDRMGTYMTERLGMPPDEVPGLRRRYFETYGTTLRGLQRHHNVDSDDFLAYVHDLPLGEFIQPNPELRELLLSLPLPRWILTNADAAHAHRVLERLGATDCFCGIIDVRTMGFACKPDPQAYQRALASSGSPDSRACVMIDDSITNLAGARRMGFTTVWIQSESRSHPDADYSLPNLMALPHVLPALWNGAPFPE